jgi:hypothetical protein
VGASSCGLSTPRPETEQMNESSLIENVKKVAAGEPLATAERLHYIFLRNTKKHAEAVQSLAIHLAVKSLSSVILDDTEEDRYDLYQFADGSALAVPLFENQNRVTLAFTDSPTVKKDRS